ncbi:MAG: haloacid dehalogenase type II [Gammaproteobacteria bacterium]|nr:haloacid dehalogenase type II [Gammaproteobacteria bacterium]
MRLHDFSTLTFDCYGTLIDWEQGLLQALAPLLRAGNVTLPPAEVLAEFGRRESAQEEATPGMRYPQLLAVVHRQLAEHWGVTLPETAHMAFGNSVPDWPAFPDSAAALQYLKRHYRLVILSNVDRTSFAASNDRLGVHFDLVCTAEDIGSYKPDPRNFAYLIAALGKLGVAKREILHTAQSLHHDHAPAQAAGLASCWIDRRHEQQGFGATRPPPATPRYDFRFVSLAALAAAHAAET